MREVARAAWRVHGEGACAWPRALVGFHALPSLAPLHLHVLSPDLDSPWLKTKRHFNSFTQASFFLRLDDVLACVRQAAGGAAASARAGGAEAGAGADDGSGVDALPPPLAHSNVLTPGAAQRAAAALNAPLRCPRCGAAPASMPKLKAHLAACR